MLDPNAHGLAASSRSLLVRPAANERLLPPPPLYLACDPGDGSPIGMDRRDLLVFGRRKWQARFGHRPFLQQAKHLELEAAGEDAGMAAVRAAQPPEPICEQVKLLHLAFP